MTFMKQFMKKYGYVGIGVYCVVGAIDLTATMALITVGGADRVKKAEDYVLAKSKELIGMKHTTVQINKDEKPSFTSLFLLAYGIHKTILLPFRLSLTAAITPTVSRRLKAAGLFSKIIK